MLCHFLYDERVSDDQTDDFRRVVLGSLSNDRPMIELDKWHQPGWAKIRPHCGVESGGGFRVFHRLSERGHIRVAHGTPDGCNSVVERSSRDYSKPLHFNFSDHSDSILQPISSCSRDELSIRMLRTI
jgi:hypothetical protein